LGVADESPGWRSAENGRVLTALDLNADVGEGFDADEQLFAVVTSANVACGFHAGDDATMRVACERAAERRVSVGAQVSYRDREGFGRRDVEIEPDALTSDLLEQIGALRAAAASTGISVRYLKPHGALYNRAARDPVQGSAVVDAARQTGLPLLGLPGSVVADLATAAGVRVFAEFFADRGYRSDGRLVPRSEPDAVIEDAAAVSARVRRLVAEGWVRSVDGDRVDLRADSVCVHGDTQGAAELARAVRRAIEESGCDVRPFR
jgi:UPF0271 protein